MDNKTIEEPMQSQAKLKESKEREFREYLVGQDVTLAIVKCSPVTPYLVRSPPLAAQRLHEA